MDKPISNPSRDERFSVLQKPSRLSLAPIQPHIHWIPRFFPLSLATDVHLTTDLHPVQWLRTRETLLFLPLWLLLSLHKDNFDSNQVIHSILSMRVDRNSAVGIAIRYGLEGPRIESRWGEIFRTDPDRPWDSPNHLHNGYRVLPRGKATGAWCWPPTPSSAEV